MNREDVIRMAREAGLVQESEYFYSPKYEEADVHIDDLERFAALVRYQEQDMNELIERLQERIDELRAKYRDNPDIQTMYRFREAQRCLELATLIAHRSERTARQSAGGSASAALSD